ncbi:MAG TPA: hypothetical protein VFA29_08290 [Candidatus Baltobacteraceae bacterium]|nr:hypothetical protein [Candidatus Baltobacteraceae bacterium]
MSISRSVYLPAAALAVAALAAACGGASTAPAVQNALHSAPVTAPLALAVRPQALQTPALLTIDYHSGALEYWPIRPKGGKAPIEIAKSVAHGGAMAANGSQVAVANAIPSQVVVYDVATNKKRVLADPFGEAADIAIGKDGTIYVSNIRKKNADITAYPQGSPPAKEITCGLFGVSGYIAIDDESDIFFNGYFSNNNAGVIEIPHGGGPNACRALNLNPETGYVSGVAIDPKTDALLTLSDPDLCAGGYEAEMTIYPKPYTPKTATVREMNANCSGGLRLNADSSILFYGDSDVSGSYSFIRSATYPRGINIGTYSGRGPSGFTTIPNTLPN